MAACLTTDLIFSVVGLFLIVFDIGSDISTAVNFLLEKDYWSLGILLFILLGSSVLVHTISWLWSKTDFINIEKVLSLRQLAVLHIFQLDVFYRRGTIVKMFFHFTHMSSNEKQLALFLQHDIGLLALFEAYSESCPQLVLMLTIYLRRGQLVTSNALKLAISVFTTAFGVTLFHRCLRNFQPEKKQQSIPSSIVYLIWNFFLIASRISALALFASVFPCYIVTHFLCWWLVFFVVACCLKTDLMDTPAGECLYRSTVALIWYFNWFNVVERRTRPEATVYHTLRLVDNLVLCVIVGWKYFSPMQYFSSQHFVVTVCVVVCNIFGLIMMMIYYKCCHPNHFTESEQEQEQESTGDPSLTEEDSSRVALSLQSRTSVLSDDEAPSRVALNGETRIMNRSMKMPQIELRNKRMLAQAKIFYS